jgi:hypothetical protein
MPEDFRAERRSRRRHRATPERVWVEGEGLCVVDAAVFDTSADGIRLRLPPGVGVIPQVVEIVGHGVTVKARVAWRRHNDVGTSVMERVKRVRERAGTAVKVNGATLRKSLGFPRG